VCFLNGPHVTGKGLYQLEIKTVLTQTNGHFHYAWFLTGTNFSGLVRPYYWPGLAQPNEPLGITQQG
jgi:hypothetical protein